MKTKIKQPISCKLRFSKPLSLNGGVTLKFFSIPSEILSKIKTSSILQGKVTPNGLTLYEFQYDQSIKVEVKK